MAKKEKSNSKLSRFLAQKNAGAALEEKFATRELRDWVENSERAVSLAENAREAGVALRRGYDESRKEPRAAAAERDLFEAVNDVAFGAWSRWLADQAMAADPRDWSVAQTLRAIARNVSAEKSGRDASHSVEERLRNVLEATGFSAMEREAKKQGKAAGLEKGQKTGSEPQAIGGRGTLAARVGRFGMSEKMARAELRMLVAEELSDQRNWGRRDGAAHAAQMERVDALARDALDETISNAAWAQGFSLAMKEKGGRADFRITMVLARVGLAAMESGALRADPEAEKKVLMALSEGPAAKALMKMGMPAPRGSAAAQRGGRADGFGRAEKAEKDEGDEELGFDPFGAGADRHGGHRDLVFGQMNAMTQATPELLSGLAPLARDEFREEIARERQVWKALGATVQKLVRKTSDKKVAQAWLDAQIALRARAAGDNRVVRELQAPLLSEAFTEQLRREGLGMALAALDGPAVSAGSSGSWSVLAETLIEKKRDFEFGGAIRRFDSDVVAGADDAGGSADALRQWLDADKLGVRWSDDDFSEFTQRAAKRWAEDLFARQTQAAEAGMPKEAAFLALAGVRGDTGRMPAGASSEWDEMAMRAATTEAEREPNGFLVNSVLERLKAKGWKSLAEISSARFGLAQENGLEEIARAVRGVSWERSAIAVRKNPQNEAETQIAVAGAFSVSVDEQGRCAASSPSKKPPAGNKDKDQRSETERASKKLWDASLMATEAFAQGWSQEGSRLLMNDTVGMRALGRFESLVKKLKDNGHRTAAARVPEALRDDLEIAAQVPRAIADVKMAFLDKNGQSAQRWETGAAQESIVASLGEELGRHGAKNIVSAAHALTRLDQGHETQVAGKFMAALNWIGQSAETADRILNESAAGRLAARMAFSQGWPLDERMEQSAKSEFEKLGLTPGGWKLLRKMSATEGDSISAVFTALPERMPISSPSATAARVEMIAMACLLSACAEANVSANEAAALLDRSADIASWALDEGHFAQKRTIGWANLGRVLALPQPVLSVNDWQAAEERMRVNKKSRERRAEKKLAELEKAGGKANREEMDALRQKIIENAKSTDFFPEKRPEAPGERDTRLEMTRALGKWALESQARAAEGAMKTAMATTAATSADRRRSVIARSEKIKDLGDWLENGPGARAALPRRFGAQSLFERMRQWHDELARAKALEGIEGRIREIKEHAGRATREGHAPSEDAVRSAAEQGRWPMAIERVLGVEVEEKSLAQERLAALEAEQRENPEKFDGVDTGELARALREEARREAKTAPLAGWVAVGLANPVDLHAEGAQMRHCVASYATYCAQAVSRIFRVESPDGVGVGTLELKTRGENGSVRRGDAKGGASKSAELDVQWEVAQFRGVHNATIYDTRALMFAQKIAVAYGEAAQANRLAANVKAVAAVKADQVQETGAQNAPAGLSERLRAQRQAPQEELLAAIRKRAGARLGGR